MKVALALREVADAEHDLGAELLRFAERHATESDLFHTGHTLARQCELHLAMLQPFTEHYSAPAPDRDLSSTSVMERIRRAASDATARLESSSILLMRDMRELYLSVQESELLWVVLVQVAQAVRDAAMLEMATTCHEAAARRSKWLRTHVKETAPQVYAS